LCISDRSGLGWWATDRNAAPGKVNIYIYIPSAMRVNASPDDPDLSALARLTDLSLTRKEGTDYKALLEARLPFAADDNPENRNSPRFAIDNGHGKVYTALSDFRNERARSSMLEALATESELRKHLAKENELREKWRKGDHSVRQAIMHSEEQTAQLRSRIASLRNAAVRLEK
ncbi:MAG: hypothetical protein K2F63_05510, partial [Muribaculaceae bacterium]|nr:hypothetical protein [Muribaculaceae bacterium]